MDKKCNRCLEFKQLEAFSSDSSKKDGKATLCRDCISFRRKNNRKSYPLDKSNRTCRTCKVEKEYTEFHKSKGHFGGVNGECKECTSIRTSKNYLKHQDKIKAKTNAYYKNNRDKCREARKAYHKKRFKADKRYKLVRNLRNRLWYALHNKGWKKNTHFNEYIGCDYPTLIAHIESQFQPGMTWENYSHEIWHIDHKVPLVSASCEEELYKLCHYTNLQPMFAKENLSKGGKTVDNK
jgi:hypothetical protein